MCPERLVTFCVQIVHVLRMDFYVFLLWLYKQEASPALL